MGIKERHLLAMWYAMAVKLQSINEKAGNIDPAPTAGEVGRAMGMTRQTAKKYLLRLVGEGYITPHEYLEKNGVSGTRYHVD